MSNLNVEIPADRIFKIIDACVQHKKARTNIHGHNVHVRTKTLKVFFENRHNPVCVACGREGNVFKLHMEKGSGVPTLSFYHKGKSKKGNPKYILMTKDHIIPASRGGTDSKDNLQIMCSPCNSFKGNGLQDNCGDMSYEVHNGTKIVGRIYSNGSTWVADYDCLEGKPRVFKKKKEAMRTLDFIEHTDVIPCGSTLPKKKKKEERRKMTQRTLIQSNPQPQIRVKGDVAVIVGRYQVDELHSAHRAIIQKLIDDYQRVIICLGVARESWTIENPLDYATRDAMMRKNFPTATIIPIYDLHNNEEWVKQLDKAVEMICPNGKIIMFGGRDSFINVYQQFGGQHDALELDSNVYVSGTAIRERLAKEIRETADFRAGMIHAIMNLNNGKKEPQENPNMIPAIDEDQTDKFEEEELTA